MEDPENSLVYENVSAAAAASNLPPKSLKSEESTVTVSGVKVYKLVGVSFGLLCMLHAALSVSLRLALFSQQDSVAEERDDCKKINMELEISLKNLTDEKDDLMRKMNDLGWVLFSCSAYYISSENKTWQASRDDCRQRGADLMIIDSEEEQRFANRFQKYMWIGLTDAQTEGTWRWVDGTRLNTSYWGTKEPNGGKTENCGDIKTFTAKNSWNDEKCSTSLYWICEKKICL